MRYPARPVGDIMYSPLQWNYRSRMTIPHDPLWTVHSLSLHSDVIPVMQVMQVYAQTSTGIKSAHTDFQEKSQSYI